MRKIFIILSILIISLYPAVQSADAADIKVPDVPPFLLPLLPPFHLAISEHFKVPEPDILKIRDRHIPDEQIPVVLFLASMAHVTPLAIIDLRLAGKTWLDISLRFGFGPDIFYVPVKEVVKGPPFGKAYGHYKNKSKKEWKKIVLDDDDIINLVNLRFLSDFHKYSPDEIIRMRERGENFFSINEKVREEKAQKGQEKYKKDSKGKGSNEKKNEKSKGKGQKD